jgi:hypothetical protein
MLIAIFKNTKLFLSRSVSSQFIGQQFTKSLLCYLKLLYKDICLENYVLKSVSVCPSFSEMPHVRKLKGFLLAHKLRLTTYNLGKNEH